MIRPFFDSPAATCELDDVAIRAGGKHDGRLLCSDLSVRIKPGERWVVLGPNGAGKSTLIATLAGLQSPAGGRVRLDGSSLERTTPRQLARRRAWCPQFWADPFPAAAWETVACAIEATRPQLTAEDTRRIAREWLTRLDMSTLADSDVRTLSGGERQRVALATAFAQAAPLLLLDEPTAHLDWSHQALLRRMLMEWSDKDGTVITAVHDLNLAWSLATHAILLDGRGGAHCGRREDILTGDLLTAAYGVDISELKQGARRWFRIDLHEEASS